MKHKNTYRYNYSSSYSNQQYVHNEPKKSRKYLIVLPTLVIAIIAGVLIKTSFSSKNKTVALDKQDSSKTVLGATDNKAVKDPPKQINDVLMGQQINAIIANYPNMQVGVSVININDGKQYTYGVNKGFIAASTSKLLTATLFLHQAESGKTSLSQSINNDTAQNQLKSMIVDSDNDAWVAFNTLMTHDALKAWANQIGMSSYDVESNIDTPSDIALLLSKLYKNELINQQNTKLLLGYMQNANEAEYIVSAVPKSVNVYHKAGWLDDRINDTAVIDDGKNPYVLVIYSKVNYGNYDSNAGKIMFKDITSSTLNQFIN
jgi:beta-lactamase class A